MSDQILLAADELLAAAKFALSKNMHPRSESSCKLRAAIETYESACEKDAADAMREEDRLYAEEHPLVSLELLRERGLL